VGNEDSLLGAPGVLDLNFFDSRLRVWVGGLNDVCVARKTTAPDVWTHVAVTRDGDGRFKIYLNGELDQADGTPDPRAYEGLAIGRSNVATGTGAQLAEYRIWKTCRTPDEIRAVFDRTQLPATPALAYYRPAAAAWDALHGPARVAKTMDFPPLVTPEAARSLDEKFAHFRTLAEKPGGDPARGKVAAAVCIACHKVGAEGGQIGPNLSAVGAMGTEAILRNILTPNAAMEPGYRVYRAELTDGSIKEGFLARQDADALIIRLPGVEDERLATDRVRRGTFTRRSLMPEGLEATFSPEQWTDLFAYLKTLR
jgi:putative heme-binding domain-containing protein